jgi:hypothetical protein
MAAQLVASRVVLSSTELVSYGISVYLRNAPKFVAKNIGIRVLGDGVPPPRMHHPVYYLDQVLPRCV